MSKEITKPENTEAGQSPLEIEIKHYPTGESGIVDAEFEMDSDISIMKAKDLILNKDAELIFKDNEDGSRSLTVIDRRDNSKALYTEIAEEIADIENYLKLFSK